MYIHLEPLFLVASQKIHFFSIYVIYNGRFLFNNQKGNFYSSYGSNTKEIAEVVSKLEDFIAFVLAVDNQNGLFSNRRFWWNELLLFTKINKSNLNSVYIAVGCSEHRDKAMKKGCAVSLQAQSWNSNPKIDTII